MLLDSVSKLSASLELGNLLCCDSNLLLSSRVDALACRTLRNAECTEADELNLVTLNESVLDCLNCSLKSLLGISLARKNDIADYTLFEGIVRGTISTEKQGTEGFGYDPIFVPEGYTESFAQLGMDIKNGISHRARAVEKLAEYLCAE